MKQKQKYKPNTAISLNQFKDYFPNAEAAREYIELQKWHGKPFCACNSENVHKLPSRNGFYQCNACRKKFSVRTGTIFQNSKIPLDKWLLAFYLMVTARKGVSSMQLSKHLGITQKSAWFMSHRIREAMGSNKNDYIFKGVVECDETYIGGKEHNKHWDKKSVKTHGSAGKIPVFGIKERQGRVMSRVVVDTSKTTLHGIIYQQVEQGAVINTDAWRSYAGLGKDYVHNVVDHSKRQYVDGQKYTNSIESVWAVLKRGCHGIYHKFSKKHLQKYLDEFDFRQNEGNCRYSTMERIGSLVVGCFAARLSWKELVAE